MTTADAIKPGDRVGGKLVTKAGPIEDSTLIWVEYQDGSHDTFSRNRVVERYRSGRFSPAHGQLTPEAETKTRDEIRAEFMRPRPPGPETNAYLDALEWVLGASYLGNGYWSDGFEDRVVQAREDAEVLRDDRKERGMAAGARQLKSMTSGGMLKCPKCGNTWWTLRQLGVDLSRQGFECIECGKVVLVRKSSYEGGEQVSRCG